MPAEIKEKRVRLTKGFLGTIDKLAQDVEERLRNAQKKKAFKDSSGRVQGSKKEKMAYKVVTHYDLDVIEDDPVLAYELVVKDKVFPVIDPLLEKESGTSSGATYMKLKFRDNIPTRPGNNPSKRELYVNAINRFITDLAKVKTLEEFRKLVDGYRSLSIYDILRFFPGIANKTNEEIDDYYVKAKDRHKNTFILLKGFYSGSRFFKDIFGPKFYNFLRFDGVHQDHLHKAILFEAISADQEAANLKAWNTNLEIKIETQQNRLKRIQEDTEGYVRERFDPNGIRDILKGGLEIFISRSKEMIDSDVKKLSGLINHLPEEFKERPENWNWLTGKEEKKDRAKTDKVKINSAIPLSFIKRVGGIKIEDKDITIDTIQKVFGFKEIEFGNYVKDSEAKEHVRHFIASVSDLFEILDLDPYQVNTLGGLSIAFGSRGFGTAMAFYQGSRRIINITKSNGDGSVAHETSHYLDNVIAEKVSGVIPTFASEAPNVIQDNQVKQAYLNLINFLLKGDGGTRKVTFYANGEKRFTYSGSSAEEAISNARKRYPGTFKLSRANEKSTRQYFGFIAQKFNMDSIEVELIRDRSDFYFDSETYANGNKYWTRTCELFARGFETYVFDKLARSERSNNYLVSGGYFDQPFYPQGRERERIYNLFDAIILAFKKAYQIKDFTPFSTKRIQEEIISLESGKKVVKPEKTIQTTIENLAPAQDSKIKLAEAKAAAQKQRLRILSLKQPAAPVQPENIILFYTSGNGTSYISDFLDFNFVDIRSQLTQSFKEELNSKYSHIVYRNDDRDRVSEGAIVIRNGQAEHFLIGSDKWDEESEKIRKAQGLGGMTSIIVAKGKAKAQMQRLSILKLKKSIHQTDQVTVKSIPLSRINVNKALFQNREEDFSKESVERILKAVEEGSFSWEVFDPVLLWQDPEDQKLYILSGHSRTHAFKTLSDRKIAYQGKTFDSIPAKITHVSREEAKKIALDSNTLSTKESELERAKYYRQLRANGSTASEVEAMARNNEGKNAKLVLNLSYLNPSGFIADSIRAFESGEVTSKTNISIIADWVGEARRRNPEFTDLHENEIARWLLEEGYGTKAGQYSNKLKFLDRLHQAKMKKYEFGEFKESEPLNLRSIITKNYGELQFDQEVEAAKGEVDKAEKEFKKKSEEAFQAVKEGKTTQKLAKEVINKYALIYTNLRSRLNQLAAKKDSVLAQSKAQTALFGIAFNHRTYLKEIKNRIKQLG